MMTDESETVSGVERIGQTAGLVWHALDGGGPQSLAKLVKTVGAHRELVLQALGWLAREDKLWIDEGKRGRTFRLR
jgi:hypothetical protein